MYTHLRQICSNFPRQLCLPAPSLSISSQSSVDSQSPDSSDRSCRAEPESSRAAVFPPRMPPPCSQHTRSGYPPPPPPPSPSTHPRWRCFAVAESRGMAQGEQLKHHNCTAVAFPGPSTRRHGAARLTRPLGPQRKLRKHSLPRCLPLHYPPLPTASMPCRLSTPPPPAPHRQPTQTHTPTHARVQANKGAESCAKLTTRIM